MTHSFNILVPTDYSEASVDVIEYALMTAEKFASAIYILHAYQVPVFPEEMPTQAMELEVKNIEDEANVKMEALIKNLKQKHENANLISLVEYGSAETKIDDVVKDKSIDLVILGCKGGNAAQALLFGSISSDSIGRIKCPLIIVPKNYKIMPIKNIAYAASWLEEDDIKGIKNLLPWANAFEAKITIVHIYNSHENYTHEDRHRYEAKLREAIGYNNVGFKLIESEDFNRGIEDFVTTEKPDLLDIV